MRGRPAAPPPSVAVLIHNCAIINRLYRELFPDSQRLLRQRDPEAIVLFALRNRIPSFTFEVNFGLKRILIFSTFSAKNDYII